MVESFFVKKEELILKLNNLEEQKGKEIEGIKKEIEEKYQKLLDSMLINYDTLLKEAKIIEKYSMFNSSEIALIIAQLMTVFEGKEYVYEQIKYYNLFLKKDFKSKKNPILLIEKEHLKEKYSDDLENLLERNQALFFIKDIVLENTIVFLYSLVKNNLEQNFDYGNFLYIKEFIDEVIEKRIENDLITISLEELVNFKNEFILKIIDLIKERFRLKDELEIKVLNEKLRLENERRIDILKRVCKWYKILMDNLGKRNCFEKKFKF